MLNRFCRLLALTVVLTGLLAVSIIPVQAESAEPMDVLVTFNSHPGPAEVGLVESLGGTVNLIYSIVPTVAVTMPADKLDELGSPPVTYGEWFRSRWLCRRG